MFSNSWIRRLIGRAGVVGAAFALMSAVAVAPSAMAAPPASGDAVVVPNDWNGYCQTDTYSTSAWGWCDGTGPQRYAIYILCSNSGVYKSSSTPWFGDRNGAWAYCPSGTAAVSSWGGRA